MDNLVTIYHGGSVERDRYGNVEFLEMQCVPVLFDDRPSLNEVISRAREELHCPRRDVDIVVEGVIHLGAPPNNLRRLIPIGSENQWDNYVRSALKSQLQCLDVVVRPLLNAHTKLPRTVSRVGNEIVRSLVDAESAPKEVNISKAPGHDGGAAPPEEIPLTQNYPSKYWELKFLRILGFSHQSFLSLSIYILWFAMCCRKCC
jgi:hypothetical protein